MSFDGSTLVVRAYGEGSNAVGIGGDKTSNGAAKSGAIYFY
ncbi:MULTISPECIES: hypothetical protein [unclassified Acidovorax]|nr:MULTISPECIES: hypothetical protein [unclassified Acidovorax]